MAQSQWITGEAARADGHAWRARACAVLTGIGTVLQDRPRLDVRGVDTPRQPSAGRGGQRAADATRMQPLSRRSRRVLDLRSDTVT
jgi:riboflavin biosynthesis pyrimidine reductase